MALLYLLEKIRMPGLNEFMLLVTKLGEETAFLVAALIVFWCVDKKKGYYVMAVGFIGTMANQIMKLAFRVPRPWVLDENFSILEQAREAAAGYSFPSGHSQSAVGTFGAIAATGKNRYVKAVCIAICVLVPFSRMYIGVHTPADVLVGSLMALILVYALRPAASGDNTKFMNGVLVSLAVIAACFWLYITFWPFPGDMDAHNLESGMKNAYTMLGCIPGVILVYVLEKKYINFETDAVWWAQILKAVLGLGVVLLVKEGLRSPLEWMFGGHLIARSVRYFLIVLTAGVIWPISFRWFSSLGDRKC